MSATLRIGRLVMTGLPPGVSAAVLHHELEQQLAQLLTPADLAQIHRAPPLRRPVTLPPLRQGESLARQAAQAIRAALLPGMGSQ